eukprot:jgi/Psemu1/4889/gm1.4889_g
MVVCGEKLVKRGFHQEGGNMPSTGQVLLPIHLPSVFHSVLHYKDLVMKLYHIYFDFDKNMVTLSPSKISKGNIYLAPATVKEGIIYLVKEWLIRKMIDWGKELLILQKVLNLPHTRSFGLEDAIETIEDLVLTEQRYLGQSQLKDKEYKGFQQKTGALVKGLLELPGIGCIHTSVTQFLQYDVESQQELHQQIFMEHIPYVFREIFVTDTEVLCIHSRVEILSHYSYLSESGKIFTLLTESLAETLVELLDELFMAKLEAHFGKDGNEVYLSDADLQKFKEAQTSQTTLYETYLAGWVMFTCKPREFLYRGFIPLWLIRYRVKDKSPPRDGNSGDDGDNISNQSQDKGNNGDDRNVTNGSLDNNGGLKPAASNLNESGNSGDNASDPRQDKKGNQSDVGNGNKCDEEYITDGSLDNDGNKKPTTKNWNESGNTAKTKLWVQNRWNKSEESVQSLNYSLDVTVSKFPLKVGCDFALHDIKVVLKDPDPEILYPIYQISQKVIYVGDLNQIRLVDGYVSKQYKDYNEYPGYKLFSKMLMAGCSEAQRKKEWKLLEDDDSEPSSDSDQVSVYDPSSNNHSDSEEDSTGTTGNEKGSEYDQGGGSDSEGEEDNEC